MVFDNLQASIKKKVKNYKDEQARKKAEEEARQEKILSGDIEPIKVVVSLEPQEKAYVELSAKRMAVVDRIVEKTTGKTKKKGVVGRAVVGGVLLGPLGALGGAATAGSKGNSTTTQHTASKMEVVDDGSLVLTNKRLMFIGQNIVTLPYNKILAVSFTNNISGKKLLVKYEGMLKDEQYAVSGEKAKDTELYYQGITKNLMLRETSP